MDNVKPVTPHLNSLKAPDMLRSLPGWLMWRFEHTAGEKKPRKVPYYVSGGRRMGTQGTPGDRDKLTTFEAARQAAVRRGFDGVGLALLPGFGVTALDFDNCVTSAGIDPLVETLTCGTYTEFSPSGNGIRAFILGELGDDKFLKETENTFTTEVFSHKGFVTFTGNVTEDTYLTGSENVIAEPVAALQPFLEARLSSRGRSTEPYAGSDKPVLGLTEPELVNLLNSLPEDLDYDTWVKVGMAVHHETQGDGFGIWDAWSSQSPKYSNSQYSNERWVSFGHNTSAEPVTITSIIRLAQQYGADPGIDIDTAKPEDFEVLEPLHGPGGRFKIMSGTDFATKVYDISWLIKGVLPKANLGFLYGPSGSGKTFATLDMCMSVAFGKEWNGRKVAQGQVLYVVAEDAAGLNLRMRAYCEHNGIPLEDMRGAVSVTEVTPNLTHTPDMTDLAKEVNALGQFNLIVIDTFSRATPGVDENDGKEVGLVIQNCTQLSQRTGAMILVVHHTGKDVSRGLKGSSKLTSDADVTLEVARGSGDDKESRSITVIKVKNGVDGDSFGFNLNVVPMGFDTDEEAVTTCTVVYNNGGKVQVKKENSGLKANQKFVKNVLAELLSFDQVPVPFTLLKETAVKKAEANGIDGKRLDHRQAERAVRESLNSLVAKKVMLKVERDGGECVCFPGAENADL